MSIRIKVWLFVSSIILGCLVVMVAIGTWVINSIVYSLNADVFSLQLQARFEKIAEVSTLLDKLGVSGIETYLKEAQEDVLRAFQGDVTEHADRFFIVSSEKTVVLHPFLERDTLMEDEFITTMLEHKNGTIRYRYQGGMYFTVYRFVEEWGWLIAYSLPEQVMFRQRTMYFLTVGGLAVLVLAGLLYVSHLIEKRLIVDPVIELERAARAIASGKLDQDIRVYRQDEIGRLADAFRIMAVQLKENFDKIEAQMAALEHMDKLKDEFMANTSHELRTPLNGIIGLADSMLDGAAGTLNERQQYNLSLIVSSGRRLSNLVNDILDFSKLRHHELHLHFMPLDLHSIADVVLTVSRILVKEKDIDLINELDAQLPAAHADENRVQQILYNLVGNAVKFTEHGTVRVSGEVRQNMVAITVSDTGIGIPLEKQTRIFEPFEQGNGSISRQYGGTGLGLAVTKQLVELHGGQILVESEAGNGAAFTFTLPVSQNAAAPIRFDDQPEHSIHAAEITGKNPGLQAGTMDISPAANTPNGRRHHILIVDDEPVNLQVLKNQLSLQPYMITLAANGHEALSAFENGNQPDLVLLDVMMPGMSGYEVCQHLRQKWAANELPVLMLTAKNRVQDLVTGFQMGANDYLVKPFSKEELLARLDIQLKLKTLTADNVRMRTEMELAHHIQTSLLPSLDKTIHPDVDIAAVMLPSEEVGGDYYDIALDEEGKLWISIGDVSGHGVTPGLIMMMAQTIHTTIVTNYQTVPSEMIVKLNKTLYRNVTERLQADHFMTFTTLKYLGGGRFQHAGMHLDLIVYRQCLQTCELIDSDGTFLNFFEDISHAIENAEFALDIGDILVLYTDGLTEAMNPEGQLLDIHGLMDIVTTHARKTVEGLRDGIIHDVLEWCHHDNGDDMSLLVIKRMH